MKYLQKQHFEFKRMELHNSTGSPEEQVSRSKGETAKVEGCSKDLFHQRTGLSSGNF